MSDVKYGIRYENYAESLLTGFGMMMQMQNLVDITLMCNTHTLRVHKVVLAASSSYFQDIFKNRPGDLLIILKMDFIVLKCLVEYIYSGKTCILESDMDELISAARFLRIKGLAELKEERDDLPEFVTPLVFNQPYANVQENSNPDEQLVQENPNYSNMYPKNPNHVVVRIPIEINSNNSDTVESTRGRSKHRQNYYNRYSDDFPKNRLTRRRGHSNKLDHKSNMLGARFLNRATRKVLRKEEKSSMQTIQEIKNLQCHQLEEPAEHLNLSEAVESILDPNLNTNCNEFIINNNEEHAVNNVEISEEQYCDNNQTWGIQGSPKEENSDINSTLSEYVDVLKSTGLPTDVPILFELEDGSYVNVSGEVLMNIVQSNSVQYEVVEQSEDTEPLIQNGVTKSIDQISQEIQTSDNALESTPDIMDCLEHDDHMNIDKMDDCAMNEGLDMDNSQESLSSLLSNFNSLTD